MRPSPSSCSTVVDRAGIAVAAHGGRAAAWRASRLAGTPRASTSCPTAARCCSTPRHNPAGAAALASYLTAQRRTVRAPLVVRAMRDKDASGMFVGAAAGREPSHSDARLDRAIGRADPTWKRRRARSRGSAGDHRAACSSSIDDRLAHLAAHRRRRIDFPARRRDEGARERS